MAASKPKSSLRPLGIVLVCFVVAYALLYPRLKQMGEEAARINREVDATQTGELPAPEIGRIEVLRAQVEREPLNVDAQIQLATLLKDVGKTLEAENAARAAARLKPDEAGPLLLLGDIQRAARRYDLAIATYRTLLKRFPDHAQAAAALGWIYITLGWTNEARELLRSAIIVNPDDPHLKAALALAHLQATDLGKSEKLLLTLKETRPQEVDFWAPLIDVYLKAKRQEDAAKVAQEALDLKPDDVKMLNGLGQAQYELGRTDEAIATFLRVVKIEPDNVPAHHRLGLCYKAIGKVKEATSEMELVYKRLPDFEQTRQILGQLYYQAGREKEGKSLIAEYQRRRATGEKQAKTGYLLLAKPRDPNTHFQMALSYQEQGDQPKAIAELTRTLELQPDHAEAQRLLTEALKDRQRSETR